MTMRLTGMYSGLETETIIQELVKAKSVKVDKLNKEKTKMEWKQEAWGDLNKKIKSFWSKTVSNMRFESSFYKKTTTVSNSSAVSVITGDGAMNGVQNLSIKELAKSGYLTGGKLSAKTGSKVTGKTILSNLKAPAEAENLSEITGVGSFTVKTGDKTKTIEINEATTVADVVSKLKEAGVNANFDEKNQRIFIGAAESGYDNDFTITADNKVGFSALSALGLNVNVNDADNAKTKAEYEKIADFSSYFVYKTDEESGDTVLDKDATFAKLSQNVTSDAYKMLKEQMGDNGDFSSAIEKLSEKVSIAQEALGAQAKEFSDGAIRIAGTNALINLNGADYESATNSIEVNGLTFTCLGKADNISVTTDQDTDGIYNMVRDFFKEYNELMNEMDKLFNAESAKDFEPLTDEEKEEMSDTEIEKWEKKIKDALFRKDDTLGTLRSSMQDIFMQGFEVNGKKTYLTNYGIETLSYFVAPDNEKHAYHIAGNEDDSEVANNTDKLKSAIATDPDGVIDFFTQLARTLYSKMTDLSAATDYSSSGSFWEDKKMKSDMTTWEEKIKEAEKKLADYEDRYYDKFSKMEVALSKLQNNTNSLLGMLGQGGN